VLWTIACLDGEVAPSPAYSGGMFFVANEYAMASAIRFNADAPEVAWQYDEYLPDVSSPVGDGQRFYITTSMGDVVALDAATGTAAWEHEFDEGFYTSPILVGDRIYVTDRSGITQIFKAGPSFELVAAPKLGEEVFATPAFMDGRIYVRTATCLMCIASQDESGS
jgi:outer membrane protein assembly factor BamB